MMQPVVWILEETDLWMQRFIVGVYESRNLAMHKAEWMAGKRRTGLKGWRLDNDMDGETSWTYDGQWYYTVTQRPVRRAEEDE